MADTDTGKGFTFTPVTIFHYVDDWFAWNSGVDVMCRIRITVSTYPKVTSADIVLVGDNLPSAWYQLGFPALISSRHTAE